MKNKKDVVWCLEIWKTTVQRIGLALEEKLAFDWEDSTGEEEDRRVHGLNRRRNCRSEVLVNSEEQASEKQGLLKEKPFSWSCLKVEVR